MKYEPYKAYEQIFKMKAYTDNVPTLDYTKWLEYALKNIRIELNKIIEKLKED